MTSFRKAPVLLAAILVLMLVSCGRAPPPDSPEGFGLVFEYGVGDAPNKNVLDTSRGTFTKDMILDPPITVKLSLGKSDLARIRTRMDEIDFWSYPEILEYEMPSGGGYLVTPYSSYYFKVTYGSNVKVLRWDDEHGDQSDRAVKLRELIQMIRETIESTAEYKALPKPKGGYM